MVNKNSITPGEYESINEVVASLYEYNIVVPSATAEDEGTIIGALQSLTPSGSRRITESFEIGRASGEDIGNPFELVLAPPSDRRIEVRKIALFDQELLSMFGTTNIRSLTKLKKKFNILEFRYVKTDTNYVRTNTKSFIDCYIMKYGATRDITGADVREIQTATIAYRYISYLGTTA